MYPSEAGPWWSGEAKTDASGRFVFERVLPGSVSVARSIRIEPSPGIFSKPSYPATSVDVTSVVTARVKLGGRGRPVIGKVTAPAEFAGRIKWIHSENTMYPQPGGPGGGPTMPRWQSYPVVLDQDGAFRVEDVKAGTYEVLFRVKDPSRAPSSGESTLATARRAVTVPAMPGGRSDEPFDLGSVSLEPVKKR